MPDYRVDAPSADLSTADEHTSFSVTGSVSIIHAPNGGTGTSSTSGIPTNDRCTLRIIARGNPPERPKPRNHRFRAAGHRFNSFDFVELKDGRTGWIGPIKLLHHKGTTSVAFLVVWTPEATKSEAHATYQHIWGKPRRGGNRRLNFGVVVTPEDIARVFPKIGNGPPRPREWSIKNS
jgi:hypothetical protein